MSRYRIADDRLLSLHTSLEGEWLTLLEFEVYRYLRCISHIEKSYLRSLAFGLELLLIGTHLQHRGQKTRTFSESIECSRVYERFERFLIDDITPCTLDEVIE